MEINVPAPTQCFTLQVEDKHTSARVGELRTAHGTVETPVFMPVGTLATVKGIDNAQLLSPTIGARMLLCNAYHLYLRPGLEVIKQAGGLHAFMGWPRGLLTDSGGYQVFSLASKCTVSDTGVCFSTALDGGKTHFFTPESVMDLQVALGADIIMPLDECTAHGVSRAYQQKALARTLAWFEASQKHLHKVNHGMPQYLFPILQGGMEADLRKTAVAHVKDKEVPGYAIGGLSVGEPAHTMYQVLEWVCPLLPYDKPRYLMGVGTPVNLLEAVARGVDMFDCVMPTRNGRNGTLFTTTGIVNIRNAQWKHAQVPLDAGLDNPISRGYSRAYLRHLFMSKERLGEYLAAVHNLAFYAALLRDARTHILAGDFKEWMRATLPQLGHIC